MGDFLKTFIHFLSKYIICDQYLFELYCDSQRREDSEKYLIILSLAI